MAGMAEDDVIQHFNPEQLTGANQFTGDPDIRIARHRIPGGMSVHEDDGMRRSHNGGPEDFPAVCEGLVEETDGHQVMPANPFSGVEQQDDEAFAIRVELRGRLNVQSPVVGGALRRIAEREI